MKCSSTTCSVPGFTVGGDGGRNLGRAGTLATMLGVALTPAMGWAQGAAVVGQAGLVGSEMRLLWATALALMIVVVTALGCAAFFAVVRRLRWLPRDLEYRLARGMRVLFGGSVLLAMILPYLVINFSPVVVVPLVGAAGFIVATGMRGQGTSQDQEIGPTA